MGRNWKRAQPQGPAPRQFLTRQRFFVWIGRNRRLAKDFEATIDSARAFLYAASVMLLVRRIARAS
jgi:transposase